MVELVVAEKPSVARDLARVLGVRPGKDESFENERYAITWCIGHLVELDEPASYDARWKPWRLDVLPMLPDEFRLRGAKHARAQLSAVGKLLRDRRFTAVINACDAGREGELIFRYVYQHARSRLPVRRLWVSSLTDEAIRRGFAALRPGRDYDALADAARSRSEADWLVGMNATRAITVRARESGADQLLSIGRVQTPTLALLVAREHEIRTFVPRPYWEVRGELRTEEGEVFGALWRAGKRPRIATAAIADAIAARDRDAPARVVDMRARTVREPAPPLFDLTSLQRTANRRFGFSAARTLEIAQALYERHKLITYPRTDSRHLSADVARELPDVFRALEQLPEYARFAKALVDHPPRPGPRVVDDSKVHDHHAIIPTSRARASLDRDEARVFDLIVRRFLGVFFPDAELALTEAWIRVGSGESPAPDFAAADREGFVEALPPPPDHYLARGRVRVVAGWQEVAGFDPMAKRTADPLKDEDEVPAGALPPLVVGQRLTGRYEPIARETKPPPRHTEATLLAAMEAAGKLIESSSGALRSEGAEVSIEALRAAMKDVGLGTPATRAAIIETLLRRHYIARDQKQLVPTETGIALIRFLAAIEVSTLASPELTGNWEARLARIARGEDSRAAFMADIARYVASLIDAIRRSTPPAMPAIPGGAAPRPAQGWRRGKDRRSGAKHRPAKPPASPRAATGGPAARPDAARAAKPARVRSSSRSTAAPADISGLRCPRCKQGRLITGSRGWGCERYREGCRFVVWFETAGKRLTVLQLRALVTSGKTRKATFVDASGKPIAARLVLDPSGEGPRIEPV